MISALDSAGLEGGYLANPRLATVHWQAAGRPVPPPRVSVAGESALWVDPAEIPAADDVQRKRAEQDRVRLARPRMSRDDRRSRPEIVAERLNHQAGCYVFRSG